MTAAYNEERKQDQEMKHDAETHHAAIVEKQMQEHLSRQSRGDAAIADMMKQMRDMVAVGQGQLNDMRSENLVQSTLVKDLKKVVEVTTEELTNVKIALTTKDVTIAYLARDVSDSESELKESKLQIDKIVNTV